MLKTSFTNYQKVNYFDYLKWKNNIIKNEKLNSIGLKVETVETTNNGYGIDLFTIGKGTKEIFIVGGTHSSEIITVDFVMQLIENLPYLPSFDPNLYTLKIIPMQNPSGYNVVTSLLDNIDMVNYENTSKEYYLRNRIDDVFNRVFKSLNKIIIEPNFFNKLKEHIKMDPAWKSLSNQSSIPKIERLNRIIENCKGKSFDEDRIYILSACQQVLKNDINKNNIHDLFFIEFVIRFENMIKNMKEDDLNHARKLHHQMFENVKIENLNIKSEILKRRLVDAYKNNPPGSIINHDVNENFVNLNSNQPNNKGLTCKNIEYLSNGAKNNIKNYCIGPAGLSSVHSNNFEFELENKVLLRLISKSVSENKYISTLLYHGTGGLLYYKPDANCLNSSKYNEFLNYNKTLAEVYNEGISISLNEEYKLIEQAENNGFGDYLRNNFIGVILIELSKMNGNPIAPYGDSKNIERTMNANFEGVEKHLEYFKKILKGSHRKTMI